MTTPTTLHTRISRVVTFATALVEGRDTLDRFTVEQKREMHRRLTTLAYDCNLEWAWYGDVVAAHARRPIATLRHMVGKAAR